MVQNTDKVTTPSASPIIAGTRPEVDCAVVGAISTTSSGVEDAIPLGDDNVERTTTPAVCDDSVLNGRLPVRANFVECLPLLGRMSLGQLMEMFKLSRKGVAESAFRSDDADAEIATRAYMCKLEILDHTVRALFHYPSVSEGRPHLDLAK